MRPKMTVNPGVGGGRVTAIYRMGKFRTTGNHFDVPLYKDGVQFPRNLFLNFVEMRKTQTCVPTSIIR